MTCGFAGDFAGKTTAEIYGGWEDGNSVVPRFALHSGVSTPANKLAGDPGLRHCGSVLRTRLFGVAKATPYKSGTREITPASKDARR